MAVTLSSTKLFVVELGGVVQLELVVVQYLVLSSSACVQLEFVVVE